MCVVKHGRMVNDQRPHQILEFKLKEHVCALVIKDKRCFLYELLYLDLLEIERGRKCLKNIRKIMH